MNIKTEITKLHYDRNAKGLLPKVLSCCAFFYGLGSSFKNFLYDTKDNLINSATDICYVDKVVCYNPINIPSSTYGKSASC